MELNNVFNDSQSARVCSVPITFMADSELPQM